MTANDRAIVTLELLRANPGGLTFAQIKEQLQDQMSGSRAVDSLAKLTRDGVLDHQVAADGSKIYLLNLAATNYTPRPRGSYT